MVSMSKRASLQKKTGKNKAMVCTPGLVWGQQSTAVYKRIVMVEEDTFWERKKTRVS